MKPGANTIFSAAAALLLTLTANAAPKAKTMSVKSPLGQIADKIGMARNGGYAAEICTK